MEESLWRGEWKDTGIMTLDTVKAGKAVGARSVTPLHLT